MPCPPQKRARSDRYPLPTLTVPACVLRYTTSAVTGIPTCGGALSTACRVNGTPAVRGRAKKGRLYSLRATMLVPADTPPPSGKSPAKRPRPSTGPDEAMELSSSFRDQQSQERNIWSPASLVEGMARKAPLVDMPPSSDSDGYQRDRWRRKRTGPRRGCRMYVPWQETTMTVPSTLCCERTHCGAHDRPQPRRKRTVMSFAVLLPAHTRSEMGRAT